MKNRLIAWAAVCLLIPGILLAVSAAKKTVAGVWEVKMAPVGQSQSPSLSLAMYSGDGSFTALGGYKALPPIPAVQEVGTEASAGAATGDRELHLTFYAIMWKEGLGNGYQRVQETLVLSEPGDEYTGHAQVDFLDANWNVVFSTTSDVKATRLETPISAMLVARPGEKKDFVGIWAVKIMPHGVERRVPHIDAFNADGSFSYDTDRRLPSGMLLGSGRGRWVATGARGFQLKFYTVTSNKEGVASGLQRVQSTLTLSEAGDEFTGRSEWEFLDANWTVVFRGFTDFIGTRLEIPDRD